MLGERLKGYVGDRKQSALAAAWIEMWAERKGPRRAKGWTLDHVTSSLSRCFNTQAEGVRFFFGDRARAVVLFDVLEVPDGDRRDLLSLADLSAKSGAARSAQLFADLTTWSGDRDRSDALFLAVEEQILKPYPRLVPITLLVTDEQYRWLPRTFDDSADDVRTERVKSPQKARERVAALAEEHGLVIAPYPFPAFERWLASSFDGAALRFEPADGLTAFAEQGELPRLPRVAHDLAAVTDGVVPVSDPLPADAPSLRRLMVDLCDEERAAALGMSAAARLDWATRLGITVTSTGRERVEAELRELGAALGVPVNEGNAAVLDALLARARRRPFGMTAVRVGSVVHLVNPAAELPDGTEKHPRLVVHRVDARAPALTRLLAEVDAWTEDDLLDDPRLLQAMTRLDPSGEERGAMLHARAQVLLSGALKPPASALVADYRGALGALLALDPPEATLRMRVVDERRDAAKEKSGAVFAMVKERGWSEDQALDARLRRVAPAAEVIVGREDKVLGVTQGKEEALSVPEDPAVRRTYFRPPAVLIESDPARARDADRWLDLVEASKGCGGNAKLAPGICWRHQGSLLSEAPSWETTPLTISASVWREADRELALAWLALRRTLRGESIRLRDGTVLAPLGGGFVAELCVRKHSPRTARALPRASLLQCVVHKELGNEWSTRTELGWTLSPLTSPVASALGRPEGRFNAVSQVGSFVPNGIYIVGEGLAVNVSFRYSPLFAAAGYGEEGGAREA